MNSLSSFRFTFLLVLPALLLFVTQSWAQTTVNVRSGHHDDYSRLVFDWPSKISYEVNKSGGTLTLSFGKIAVANIASINTKSLSNIGDIVVNSNAGQPLNISVQIKSSSKFRHFKIGNRIILDVYNSSGRVATSVQKTAHASNVKHSKHTSAADQARQGRRIVVDTPPSKLPVAKKKMSVVEPHVVTISATSNVGMAAFERAGFLWLVFDDPNLKVPPILSGPNQHEFPAFAKMKLPDGVAFRMEKPDGFRVYGEGGGLMWRLILTPNPRDTKPAKPETRHEETNKISGGSLFWPMKAARKIIKFTDPAIGDEIQVVTVDNSSDYAGHKRDYVEFEVLTSSIGLALASKVEDIQLKRSSKGVSVMRPQGLALSPERDTAPLALKDDIQKEREFFEKEENSNKMTTIFDFGRWEMGGIHALQENRRILMVGLGHKEGHLKVEDLITLAKLNIANDRGPEALGLLRVAEKELPGIQENAEFIALRGAAGALSGKHDEAIEDLASSSIKQYEEIGYWKAFALAGLEDWQQADSVMPSDFELLVEYPEQIKQPISLALSEVALRAGKTDKAYDLLNMLRPEYEGMSLARRSAWKYLNGELERQMDRPKEAIRNWESLISGEDDYYRAKSGLSLTKLQLERKKITPAKAIDRLEGLRYAWRGDELETLINYRLGEVYIDNDNYLKGLFVLRNAISLSPNSIMSQEVTDYMTETFRSLFMDGKLKDVSPLDAVSIYDEFKELTPIGETGDIFVQQLAERLVDVDLLGRAGTLLQHQLEHRLKGKNAATVAVRLAVIRLLDSKPESALKSLARADTLLKLVIGDPKFVAIKKREIRLLRARALAKVNRPSDSLALLDSMKNDMDVLRLRADVAWNAGQWEESAESFQDLIIVENISLTRPVNEYQGNLILNRAIALNLAGNRVAISNLRERYGDLMEQSDRAKLFDLVTRPRQLGLLGNRDSVLSLMSEVDLFGDFLKSYHEAK